MKDSIIYNSDSADINNFKNLAKVITNKNELIKNNSKGIIPCPRDGHSSLIHNNKLIIFGGDRNKLSLNDLYYFNLESFYK